MTETETPHDVDLRYPIGRFVAPDVIDRAQVDAWIDDIAAIPAQLRTVVESLDDAQLDTPYRPGGWTCRQVVHHVADSNLNSSIRFKWTLTEERPTIKPYFEERWAELADYRVTPVSVSLDLLDALHLRWCDLLRSLDDADLAREFIHPETDSVVRLDVNVGIYSWHGRHHIAHITRLADREGWDYARPS